ncbi:MgtC/SapB family protein [Rhodobium gokarnense]|uniref:Protein MgtC n=1 Tax=Rhodobium gokarnense TaxID=364296 RepID=A0ABT3HG31_9HYPH|nr:MgtC/SapB family protein [Rhodobium gokarnense]MCW2309363.1 putative Mg2+ transporter-C (MgtC) family protein [Rhodobium gokarnense]
MIDTVQTILSDGFASAIPPVEMVVRLVVAAALAAVIGFEREWRDRPAGLRTHILVAIASATFAMITIEIVQLPLFSGDNMRADPLRLVEAITSGVAFLAAGFIIFHKGEVHGVTTGAGMWLAACIGLASGLGLFALAFLACIAGAIVVVLLRRLEVRLKFKGRRSRKTEE